MAGLYIHTPFCVKKCDYCDFFSVPPTKGDLALWPRLIQRHLRLIAREKRPKIDSIFFGGGTPSLLSATQIDGILTCCRELFSLSSEAEISLEANPGTVNAASLEGYLAAGVNRLSLGIQSFDDSNLQLLGRIHNASEAIQAFESARAAGFSNISIDLMFALPGQHCSDLDQEIAQLLALSPDHVGIYGLSIEEGTPLQRRLRNGQVAEATEETYAESYLLLDRLLTAAGYEHYEISNFARPTHRCRHNQGYWQRKTCLAVGAGAHGFDSANFGRRYTVPANLPRYRQRLYAEQNPAVTLERFNQQQAMAETLYLALRTSEGLDRALFSEQFGTPPEKAFPEAFCHLSPNLKQVNNHYFFTVKDWLLYDYLISRFL